MSHAVIVAAMLLALSAAQGCATKNYGRQGALTSYEKESMTCREIELDLAKTGGFVDQVNKESEFSGLDVLAILGDFGIGNSLEKSAALESATRRIEQLRALREAKKCSAVSA